jgi:hypothetical protein
VAGTPVDLGQFRALVVERDVQNFRYISPIWLTSVHACDKVTARGAHLRCDNASSGV